ncbi:MAG: DUF4395 domain-containing protein [Sulfurospirillum sp.]|nr:DUF4395 domain-containing protein [Sulfurospirillum sp.]
MSQSCPISLKLVDGTIARINAFWITSLVLLFLATSQVGLLYFLFLDFIIRLSGYLNYSLVFLTSRFVKKIFGLKTKMTDGAAKKLAAYFGLVFIGLMIFCWLFDLHVALHVTAFILLTCSSLEVLFNYCVGCKIYYIFKKLHIQRG